MPGRTRAGAIPWPRSVATRWGVAGSASAGWRSPCRSSRRWACSWPRPSPGRPSAAGSGATRRSCRRSSAVADAERVSGADAVAAARHDPCRPHRAPRERRVHRHHRRVVHAAPGRFRRPGRRRGRPARRDPGRERSRRPGDHRPDLVGRACDTSHALVIGADGRTLTMTRPACEGDSLGGVGHVLRLTFDAPAPAGDFVDDAWRRPP